MREVAYLDPMIGFVCPRSNNATLATLPHSSSGDVTPQYGYAAFKRHPSGTAALFLAADGGRVSLCLFVKWSVYREVGAYDVRTITPAMMEEEPTLSSARTVADMARFSLKSAFVWQQGERPNKKSEEPETCTRGRNAPIMRYVLRNISRSRGVFCVTGMSGRRVDGVC